MAVARSRNATDSPLIQSLLLQRQGVTYDSISGLRRRCLVAKPSRRTPHPGGNGSRDDRAERDHELILFGAVAQRVCKAGQIQNG